MVMGIVFGTPKGNYEKVYTKEQLKKAVEEVRSGAMTAYTASLRYVEYVIYSQTCLMRPLKGLKICYLIRQVVT